MATSGLPAASTPGIGLVKFGLFAEDSNIIPLSMSLASVFREGERWLSGIIVVNDGSSGQTACLKVDKIKVIHLLYKLGLERGIATGIQCAMKLGVDSILLFDDDSIFCPIQ
jgi:glycosyltransferase involved in cell wall biosynthesis